MSPEYISQVSEHLNPDVKIGEMVRLITNIRALEAEKNRHSHTVDSASGFSERVLAAPRSGRYFE